MVESKLNKPFPRWRVPVDSVIGLKPIAGVLRHVMHRFDIPLMRLTKGRFNLTMGLPSILLTTTGRKSGLERYSPLLYVNFEEHIVIIGTRFGGNTHPAWYYNLKAEPRATVTKEGEVYEVKARLATDEQRPLIWAEADRIYIGYPKYRERVTDRKIPMFILERL